MTVPLLLVALLLLLINGFFVGAEVALTAAAASHRSILERQAATGRRAARLAVASARDLSFMLTGAQLGITMASLGLGFVAEPAIADVLEAALADRVGLTGAPLHAVAGVIALTIVVVLHMVVGEMAPKNIAITAPVGTLLWTAVPFRLYAIAIRPPLWALNGLANLLVRALGVTPRDELTAAYTPAQIGAMLGDLLRLGVITTDQQQLADRTLRFATRPVRAVMTPRSAMHSLSASLSVREIERESVVTGYSRFPLHGDNPDQILGFVHIKDLLAVDPADAERPLPATAIRPIPTATATAMVDELLLTLRRARAQIALVVDEYGSPAGLVTLEDLVEGVVGDIRDEYDTPSDDVREFEQNRFVIPGDLRTDRLAETTGCRVPPGPYSTVAGFLMDQLGAVPQPGAEVVYETWLLRVRRMQGPRIETVDVIRQSSTTEQAASSASGGD